jgi:hypothetical protein
MSRGPRPQNHSAYREEPREAGFYVRPVGFDTDVEVGGRASCRIARVQMDQIFDEGSGVQYEQLEKDMMPDLVSEPEDEDGAEDRMKTRGQMARWMREEKKRSADTNNPEAHAVQHAEGLMASQAKKQRKDQLDKMDTEKMVKADDGVIQSIESKLLHDQKLSAWAWSTGSAEKYQGEKREEEWENHGDNSTANYIRRKDVLKQVGLQPEQYDIGATEHLLQYHLWPGPREMDMRPIPIMGTEREACLMNEHRLLQEEEDPKVRMRYLKEICRTRSKIAKELQDGMNEHDVRMHQDVRFWWDENQRHVVWHKLDEVLMGMATDPQSELMDRSTFMEIYDWHIQAYLERTGPYEMPDYDEEEARKDHMRTFDFAGQKAEIVISQLEEGPVILSTGAILCDKVQMELMAEGQQQLYKSMVGKLMFAATPFGQKQSPTVRAAMLEELGKGLAPDWVAPPEGIQADSGEKTGNGEHESGGELDGGYNTRSKSRRSGAGLPVPEGCLHNARCEWKNGQSSRDPGDM